MQQAQERRTRIVCPQCGTPMVFIRQITPPVEGLYGLIYRCPVRNNEGGCGHTKEVLAMLSPHGQEVFV